MDEIYEGAIQVGRGCEASMIPLRHDGAVPQSRSVVVGPEERGTAPGRFSEPATSERPRCVTLACNANASTLNPLVRGEGGRVLIAQ
jgi:hypothetical protein